ncbi:hypothetical protein ACRAWD_10405 [Caulobacter segnis]
MRRAPDARGQRHRRGPPVRLSLPRRGAPADDRGRPARRPGRGHGRGGADLAQSGIPPLMTYYGQFIDHDITANTDRDNGKTFSIVGDAIAPLPRDLVVSGIHQPAQRRPRPGQRLWRRSAGPIRWRRCSGTVPRCASAARPA